jgi:hypothetical protein
MTKFHIKCGSEETSELEVNGDLAATAIYTITVRAEHHYLSFWLTRFKIQS